VRRFFLTVFLLGALTALAVGAWGLWWVHQPLKLSAPSLDLSIEPGTTPRGIAQAVADTGVDVQPRLLYWWFRVSGQSRQIRAGSYELERGVTPQTLLNVLVRGEEATRSLVLVEGWNIRQVRAALAKADQLKAETADLTDEALMEKLGRPGQHPEGRFFPDTYTYSKNSTDTALLRRAMRAMDRKLAAAWAARASDLPFKSPDEALILASIVEKETGKAGDRPQIASVFVNRLRVGMPLQTDPTVIYGLGERYSGKLTRAHLKEATPYNTYMISGLPPTPIAMVGREAIHAALNPVAGNSLYFVARGDGSHVFSDDLEAHNNAVREFQLKRRADYRSSPAPASAPETSSGETPNAGTPDAQAPIPAASPNPDPETLPQVAPQEAQKEPAAAPAPEPEPVPDAAAPQNPQ
jgi:UPF0755 protein